MSEIKLVTKQGLALDQEAAFNRGEKYKVSNPVNLKDTNIGLKNGVISNSDSSVVDGAKNLVSGSIVLSGKYNSGYEVPLDDTGMCFMDKLDDMNSKGIDLKSSNTLSENWDDYMTATRLDITMRKEAKPTVRQSIYKVITNPNFTKNVSVSELNPYGVVFTGNNGNGQSVKQAENRGGQEDIIKQNIYAAGYTHTLLADLFDGGYDAARLNDGVAVGYSAIRDDLAIAPIVAGTYTGAKATAASTSGTARQELLYNTMSNGVDDLAKRKDPITGKSLGYGDMVVLASEYDAAHIQFVLKGGLPSVNEKKYPGIPSIDTVVGYDGEVITLENETFTYAGITSGAVYLIKRSRYLQIAEKLGLTVETDANPSVANLAREQKAYYFVEALYNAKGILNNIQKVTLSSWA